jgi:CRP/FNR family transcriptional regulator
MISFCQDCPDFLRELLSTGKSSCPFSRHVFKKKQFLFLQNDDVHHVYGIIDGLVKLTVESSEQRSQIVALKNKGSLIGIECAAKNTYSATAATLMETEVCMIMKEQFRKMISCCTESLLKLIGILLRELEESRRFIHELGKKNSEEKIIDFLSSYSALVPKDAQGNTPVYLTRQEISEYLGLTQETVSRILNKLKNEEIIELNAHSYRILIPEKLRFPVE